MRCHHYRARAAEAGPRGVRGAAGKAAQAVAVMDLALLPWCLTSMLQYSAAQCAPAMPLRAGTSGVARVGKSYTRLSFAALSFCASHPACGRGGGEGGAHVL